MCTVGCRRVACRVRADSAPGTIERLDRFADEHAALDRQETKYSPPSKACDKRGVCAKLPRPAEGGRTRLELEEELFGVRAMRHVFRLRGPPLAPPLTLQEWATVLNPILKHGFPTQWAITRDRRLTEPAAESRYAVSSPERAHALAATKARGTGRKAARGLITRDAGKSGSV